MLLETFPEDVARTRKTKKRACKGRFGLVV